MHYVIPEVINRPGTVIAVNVGGALIPGLLSIFLYVTKPIMDQRDYRHRSGGGGVPLACPSGSWPRHRASGFRPPAFGSGRRLAAVAQACGAARLYQRLARHADRSRSSQPGQGTRAGGTDRFDRRGRNLRRNLSDRHHGGADRKYFRTVGETGRSGEVRRNPPPSLKHSHAMPRNFGRYSSIAGKSDGATFPDAQRNARIACASCSLPLENGAQ